ncbi:VCBS repeat-containing protein [Emticicia sp. BO119]|uniref:VCBS repeat-containing protein n=1 Tax=Emticicia sp. BO119 TaxID=2757768 RepID=UPI0015F01E23|nr:VCBS repeat-containing protein [Emticicia sp. BO119]MBA4852238.1 VCBS repeat-containing protein [Emticicia sp. BO119]
MKPIFFSYSFQKLLLLLLIPALFSCSKKTETVFTKLYPEETGIQFSNRITENDTMNIVAFEYVYNGGGVAMGDFNNDNKVDVYFTGNQVSNKLYLNEGTDQNDELKFKDVTAEAHVSGEGRWCNGVAVVDINNDNLLDIYISASVKKVAGQRANLLYVNQGVGSNGIPSFREMAADYGIADTTHTTNAAFFDYDNDGDLDLYVLVNEMEDINIPNMYRQTLKDGTSKRTHRLYRNDWDETKKHPYFTNVSKEEGILIEGFGLGVNITDINQDGWKDIYVTNDFLTNDLLYINQHSNGKHTGFAEQAKDYFKHTSYSAMGNEVSDINNDGLVDIIAVDMMPFTNKRKKMMTMANNYQTFQNNDRFNYTYQYPRNTLQINQGKNPLTGKPIFSEIGLVAGVAQTDWSWAPMVVDFDNDGMRDIIITNGFPKDITDQDFMAYRQEVNSLASATYLLDFIPSVKIKNFAFHNKGNFQFEDVTEKWGMAEPSFSNGAAYADLDNDGDLDYIVNNINDSASVYRNNSIQLKPQESNYLRVKFNGNLPNIMGLGAIVEIQYNNGQKQVYEHTPYRGYISSVEPVAHFGLGRVQKIDQLKVIWQSGKTQLLKNIKSNQVLSLKESDATTQDTIEEPKPSTLFTDISDQLKVPYVHEEEDYIDFNVQKLLPHKMSQYGPALAVGDVNGDGLEDIFIGGAKFRKGKFLIQNKEGKFSVHDLLPGEDGYKKIGEDMGVLLFDADNDKDLDLYIVGGSSEFNVGSPALQDKFYVNDGKGHFTLNEQAIPSFLKSGSCVKAADYDHDGDLDLFIGGRVEPNAYPKPVSSYILRNDSANGQIRFTDATAQIAPKLQNIGLVCDALWSDYDNDGWQDLIVTGEWMPVTILKNNKGKLELMPESGALASKVGWWTSITSGDFDNDGDIDYIAGNLGMNTLLQASDTQPIGIYAKDFNNDGFYDAIPTVYFPDDEGKLKEFPFNTRDDLAKQFIQTRQRFQNYAKFSEATIDKILKPEELKDALVLKANWMKSSYIENKGNGQFEMKELPIQAQFAPIYGMVVEDFDQDGNLDVLMTGNDYGTELLVGRHDALNGLLLKGDGKGNFTSILPEASGYCVMGDAKSLVLIKNAKGRITIVTSQNRGDLRFFSYQKNGTIINLAPNETSAILKLNNGKSRKAEFGFGSSFLSQSSHSLFVPNNVNSIEIMDIKGKKSYVKP